MASFAKFPGHMVALWLAVAGCAGGGNPQDTVVCSPPCVDGETCEDGRSCCRDRDRAARNSADFDRVGLSVLSECALFRIDTDHRM